MVWNNGEGRVPEQTHGYGHNVGQHIAMNRMIDEAALIEADYFVRVDEDCFFETKDWLKKMVSIQQRHLKKYRQICVLSPMVDGLRNPPVWFAAFCIGKYKMKAVNILGGICRMAPMGIMRYWRWDERSAMGFSEATNFATYCQANSIPMVISMNIHVNHGESTETQEAENPDWAYEHTMLQIVPYGL